MLGRFSVTTSDSFHRLTTQAENEMNQSRFNASLAVFMHVITQTDVKC